MIAIWITVLICASAVAISAMHYQSKMYDAEGKAVSDFVKSIIDNMKKANKDDV